MRAEALELVNFCQHRQRSIQFQPGLTAVIGPNGCGKSNLLGAMKYAITGEHPNTGGKDANISQFMGTGERSLVEFTFSHGSTRATVRRLLTSGQTTLQVEGGETIRGDTRVNAHILEILETDKQILSDVVIVNQGELFGFLAKTPAKRAEAFGKLFHTDKAETCWAALGKHAGNLNVPAAAVDLDSYRRVAQQDRERLGQVQTALAGDTSSGIQGTIVRISGIIRETERRDDLKHRLETCRAEVQRCGAQRDLVQREFQQSDDHLKSFTQALNEATAGVDTARQVLAIHDQHGQVERQREAIIRQIEAWLRETPTEPQQPVNYTADSRNSAIAAADVALSQVARFVTSFDPSTGRTECPTCRTPVTSLAGELEKARQQVPELTQARDALVVQHRASEAYRQQVKDYQAEQRRVNDLVESGRRQLEALPKIDQPTVSREECQTRIDAYQQHADAVNACRPLRERQQHTLSQWAGQATACQAQYDQLIQELSTITLDPPGITPLPQLLASQQARFNQVQTWERESAVITAKIKQADDFVTSMEQVQAEATMSRLWLDRVAQVRDILHRDAAPRFVAQRNLLRVEAAVNENLAMFETEYRVAADQGLSFQASFFDGRQQPAERLSAGQKVVLALSFRLAVNFMYADLNFLALDEPTAYLDEHHISGFEPVLRRLREFTTARGLQCMMITHETSLAPLFDSVIELAD